MIKKINWEKNPPDRYSQRKLTGYIFKENDIEIGFFQIKGFLNREVTGKLFNCEIEFKDRYVENRKWFSPSTYTALSDTETKEYVAKITGSTSIKYWKNPIYKREIVTKEDNYYIFQISNNNAAIVFEENSKTNLLNCFNPKSEKGELIFTDAINEAVLLATFYILHQFMELKESTSG